jgi:hypothetical protein
MKIELDVSEDNELNRSAFWLIIDPCQMMKPNPANVAIGMVTGLFLSREEAEKELSSRRYDYGKNAVVWCSCSQSGTQYDKAYREALEKANTEGTER